MYLIQILRTLSARVPGGYDAGIYQDKNRLDIGLGMDPFLTGKGQGSAFIAEGLKFMKAYFNQYNFRLVVACFNKRAIAVYGRLLGHTWRSNGIGGIR